jgi:predicted RNase H-like HicB family nuclease
MNSLFGELADLHVSVTVSPMRKSIKREFTVIVERDEEGYYVASVPEIRGCHTQARSLDKLITRVREAIALCLEVEDESPQVSEFVGVQRVTV